MCWADDDYIPLYWYIWCLKIELFKTDAQPLMHSSFTCNSWYLSHGIMVVETCSSSIYPQLCLQFVMNINYLNLFQAPTPGIVLRWGFTREWLISSAHQMWSSRSPPSPSSLVWRSRWQSATCNVVAQHLIISKWLEMQLNRMFWEFLVWENSV